MQSESKSIVLHYWSLSVEDQVYIFFPFIAFSSKYLSLCLSLLLFSYIYSIFIYCYNYQLLYFSSLSRAWELLLEFLLTKHMMVIKYEKLILISIIFTFFCNRLITYVPISSIIPLLLSSLLLINQNKQSILSSFLLAFLGNISYPFYIFHYIVLFENDSKRIMGIVTVFIETIVVSYIIYMMVIKSVNKLNISNLVIIILYFLGVILLVAVSIMLRTYNINMQQKNLKLKYSYIDVINEWNNFFRSVCSCYKFFVVSHNSNNIILLLMDSHGEQWSNVFIPYSIKQKYVLVQIYIKDYFICQKEYEKLNLFFSKYNSIKYIIIAHSVHCIHNHPILFINYIKYLLNFTKCIYIIQENPKFLFNPTQFIFSKNNIKSYGVIGVNATFNKIPIILDECII